MALIRVKRRLDEEPAEALRVACKRICMGIESDEKNESCENISSVFTFAGTVENDKLGAPQIAKVIQDAKKRSPKKRVVNVLERSRNYSLNAKKDNRFKLINSHRTQLSNDEIVNDGKENTGGAANNLNLSIYDVEDEEDTKELKNAPFVQECAGGAISCNGVELIREHIPPSSTQHSYVYDFYYAPEFDDTGLVEQSFNIEKYLEPNSSDFRDENSDLFASDEEDSNDENYYKNDYPDEDSDFETRDGFWRDYDEQDEDVSEWLTNTGLGDEDELVHSEPQPSEVDIYHHGLTFARYKAKILKEFEEKDEMLDGEDEIE